MRPLRSPRGIRAAGAASIAAPRRLPSLLLALAVLGAGACVSVSARPGGPGRVTTRGTLPAARLPRTGDEPQTSDRDGKPTVAMAKRRVTAKQPPATLVASDGLRCTVARDRYEEVSVGDTVLCLWTTDVDGSDRPDHP